MMSRNELLTFVGAVLSTLAEQNTGTPESMIYIALGMDWDKWEIVRDILVRGNFVTIKNNYVELTPLGKEKGDEINARVAAKAAEGK